MMKPTPQTQQGAALLVSMILLIVLTMYGLSSSNLSVMQVQMTATSNDSQLALTAAEAAVHRAVVDIEGISKSDEVADAGFFVKGDAAFDLSSKTNWSDANITQIKTLETTAVTITGEQSARYFIVYLGEIKEDDGNGTGNWNDAERWKGRTPQLGDRQYSPSSGNTGNAEDDNYTIENVLFKIVAMGTGADASGIRVVEVFYQRTLKVLKATETS